MATRPYEQRARAEESEKTRRRIICTVLDQLEESPAEPISIGNVAKQSGVARSTVYAIFGSRSGLLDQVARELEDRSGLPELIEAGNEPDVRDYIRKGFRLASSISATNREAFRALRSMAQVDGEPAGKTFGRMEQQRAEAMHDIAARLDEEGLLREGLSRVEAENMLWVLTSFDSFESLYAGKGLTLEDVGEQLIAMAERLLYAEPYDA